MSQPKQNQVDLRDSRWTRPEGVGGTALAEGNDVHGTLQQAKASNAPVSVRTNGRARILIIDDDGLVGNGVAALVNRENDLEVCGRVAEDPSALSTFQALKPDLVVLGMGLEGKSGLDLLRRIQDCVPGQKVLMLSVHDESLFAPRAFRMGASGYVMKREPTSILIPAIRRILAGGTYLSQQMQQRLFERSLRGRSGSALHPMETLTERELAVFRLLGRGKNKREIACELSVSVKTVDTHRAHIKEKLGLKSGSQLLRAAVELEQENPAPVAGSTRGKAA